MDEVGLDAYRLLQETVDRVETVLFTQDQLESGAVLLYVVITLYTFLGLAIVCDEFFVPALELISERLELSNDVAGATFMAAGGSAPEFFTSLVGNFMGDASVGIGTIVGSAVFNVLLVIGTCAFVSPEPLALTWFPLARDASFYAVDLLVLAICFLDGKIYWYEAICLFLLYVAYAAFMVPSGRIEEWATGATGEKDESGRKMEGDSSNVSLKDAAELKMQAQESSREPRAETVGSTASNDIQIDQPAEEDGNDVDGNLSSPDGPGDGKKAKAKAKVKAKPKAKASSSGASKLSEDEKDGEPGKPKKKKSLKKTSDAVASGKRGSNASKTLQEDAVQGAAPPQGDAGGYDVEMQMGRGFSDAQRYSIGHIALVSDAVSDDWQADEKEPLCIHKFLQVDAAHGAQAEADAAAGIPFKDASGGTAPDDAEDSEEESEPLSLEWPADGSTGDKVHYVFAIPLMVMLSFTIPDVRAEGKSKWYIVSFTLSILWIAIFTYFMVDAITVISLVLQIPITVFALTIVAAGTSVPDMLTSIIVARKGKGDMAVSSSIGSNIFDVTFGMPVPWLFYMMLKGQSHIAVGSKGLLFSISLLLGMLLTTVVAIMLCKWIMSRQLGGSLIILYIVFITICLVMMA